MNIQIADILRQHYLQPAEITEQEVRDAVLNEDAKKIIPLSQDMQVIYFLKKRDDHYLLVDGRWSSPNLSVSAVFKILSNTIEEIGIGNPLAILQNLAEQCGYQIQIGEQRSKFIFDETILIPKVHSQAEYYRLMSQLVTIHGWNAQSKDVVIVDRLVNFRQGQNYDHVGVAFAYAISTTKYLDYLKN